MKTELTFIPGQPVNAPGDTSQNVIEQPPTIELADGSRINLHGYEAGKGPRQYKRSGHQLPTLEARNRLGALFCAAPDMLQALKLDLAYHAHAFASGSIGAFRDAGYWGTEDPQEMLAWLQALKTKAIAKAEGAASISP